MKKILFACTVLLLSSSIGKAKCQATVTVDNGSKPDVLVTNDCLGKPFTLKWQVKNGGHWSTVFPTDVPCSETVALNQPRKRFGDDPDGDHRAHDTCTITSSSVNTATNYCNGSNNLLCYSYSYYPTSNASGQASDPQIIVDQSNGTLGLRPRNKK